VNIINDVLRHYDPHLTAPSLSYKVLLILAVNFRRVDIFLAVRFDCSFSRRAANEIMLFIYLWYIL